MLKIKIILFSSVILFLTACGGSSGSAESGATATNNDVQPVVPDNASAPEETPPAEQNPAPAEDSPAPEEDLAPIEESLTHTEEDSEPTEESAEPTEEGSAPGEESPEPSDETPPPAEISSAPPPLTLARNTTVNYELLFIRAQFSDTPFRLSDAEWRQAIESNVVTLQRYLDEYGFGRVTLNVNISPVIDFERPASDFFSLFDLSTIFEREYRTRAEAALDDGFDLEIFNRTTQFVYSYPPIAHNVGGGGFGSRGRVWLPGELGFHGGLIHELGHAMYGMPHSQGIEGSPLNQAPDESQIVLGEINEGLDGLHMIGSEGVDSTGLNAPFPVPYLVRAGWIPEQFVQEITSDGMYRLYDSFQVALPTADERITYHIDANGLRLWFSFSPRMTQHWSSFDSQGFERGLIVHRQYDSRQIALLDFTPGSFRSQNPDLQQQPSEYTLQYYLDSRDGALTTGMTFTVPESNITVQPVSVGSENGVRYIEFLVTGL